MKKYINLFTALIFGSLFVMGCGEQLLTELETPSEQPGSMQPHATSSTVTYMFCFDSSSLQFDFGNNARLRTGSFSYDGDNPVSFNNGQGFYVVDFNFAPALSFDPQRDVGWVPEPVFDNTTVETLQGQLKIINDQWELFDSNGNMVFQIFANPDGFGGFTGYIAENGTGGGADLSYTRVNNPAARGLAIRNCVQRLGKPGS